MKPSIHLALSLFASAVLYAGGLSPAPTDASLVVYNGDIGLLHEERKVILEAGRQTLHFNDIADSIVAASVNVHFPKGVNLYSQQYRYDSITLSALLKAHIGQAVRIRVMKDEGGFIIKPATLLSSNGRLCIVKTADTGIFALPAEQIIFDAVPNRLVTKPSLLWSVDTKRTIDGTLSLDYLLKKITWKSDYSLTVNGDTADLSGWITIDNRSTKRFENISLTLLAGEVGMAEEPTRHLPYQAMKAAAAEQSAGLLPIAHAGYYLYPVHFPVTIAANEKLQIKFADEKNLSFTRKYEAHLNNPLYLNRSVKHSVGQLLTVDALKAPLPAGVVRTYSAVHATTVLLGESRIPHTPKHDELELMLGADFDTAVSEELVERNDDKAFFDVTVAYEISNRGDTTKKIALMVPFIKRGRQLSSVTTQQPYRWKDGNTLLFDITVEADSKLLFEVRYRNKK